MNLSDILNPTQTVAAACPGWSSPLLTKNTPVSSNRNYGKARSRFSELEDTIICEGVAKGLTWGQISSQLPHRKRATCFNRYRTLQGIRKSRKRVSMMKPGLEDASFGLTSAASSRRSSIFTPSPSPRVANSCCPSSPLALSLDDMFSRKHTYPHDLFGDIHHQPKQLFVSPTWSSPTVTYALSNDLPRQPSVDVISPYQQSHNVSRFHGYARYPEDTFRFPSH